MHCLSTYLDSQLLPFPSQPDAKPFSKEHFIKLNEKVPLDQNKLAISQVSDKPPHYRLVVGEEIYDVCKVNYCELILLFFYFFILPILLVFRAVTISFTQFYYSCTL